MSYSDGSDEEADGAILPDGQSVAGLGEDRRVVVTVL